MKSFFRKQQGSTSVAAIRSNRNYIGFERDEKYFNIASERIVKELQK